MSNVNADPWNAGVLKWSYYMFNFLSGLWENCHWMLFALLLLVSMFTPRYALFVAVFGWVFQTKFLAEHLCVMDMLWGCSNESWTPPPFHSAWNRSGASLYIILWYTSHTVFLQKQRYRWCEEFHRFLQIEFFIVKIKNAYECFGFDRSVCGCV